MAGPSTPINYFRIMPSYNLQARGSWLNLVLKHIINCKPEMHPWQQVWFRERFNNPKWVREQEFRFALNKRPWYVDTINLWDLSGSPQGEFVSDVREADGIYYALRRSDATGLWQILTMENRRADTCERIAVPGGEWVWEWKIWYEFNIDPCNPLNFIEQRWPVNPKVNRLSAEIRNEDGVWRIKFSTTANIGVYDYMFLYEDTANVPSQYKQIVEINWNVWKINWPFAGILDDENARLRVSIGIYEKLWKGLLFWSEDWIQYIATGKSFDDYTVNKIWSLESIDSQPVRFIISYQDRIVFGKWPYVYVTMWWENIWSILNSFEVVGEYNDGLVVGQYVVITGDSDTAVIYPRWTDNGGNVQYRIYENDNHRWTWNKWSFLRRSYGRVDRFVIFDNYGELWSYDVIPYDDWTNVIFRFQRADIWEKFVWSHLDMLSRDDHSKVFITEDNKWINVYITDYQRWRRWSNSFWTKILKFDRQESFWHVRIVDGIDLYGDFFGFHYGDSIYVHWWNTDNDNEISQIIAFNFGDITNYDIKHLNRIDLIVWYDSNITNDKFYLQHDYINSGYRGQKDFYFGWVDNNSRYIKLLNAHKHNKRMYEDANQWWTRDIYEYESGKLLELQDMWHALYWDKLVTNSQKKDISFYNDMNWYKTYFDRTHDDIAHAHNKSNDGCNLWIKQPVIYSEEECVDVWYKSCKLREKDDITFASKYYRKDFYQEKAMDKRRMIPRYWQISYMINQTIIESNWMIVASGDQSIQFCGLTIWFTQTDWDLHDREDEAVQRR